MDSNMTMVKFNDYDDCYICFSVRVDSSKANGIATVMSFNYLEDDGKKMVEWEPQDGAIAIYEKIDSDDERLEDPEFKADVKPHWLLGQVITDWTQTNVVRRGLPIALINQDFEKIFQVLKSYT